MAITNFQAECPVIQKTKSVYEKDRKTVRYKYAPIDAIIEQAKEHIAKNKLSYSLDVEQDDKMLTVICNVKHAAGHHETSKFSVPIGSEGYMSDVQKYGARSTFAKRYAFCNAFGILSGDEDTDAVEPEANKTMQPVANNVQPMQKKPEPIQKVVADPKKAKIVQFCNKLGIEDKTATGYSFFVQDKAGMELLPENFDAIIETLETLDDFGDKDSKVVNGEVVDVMPPKKTDRPWENDPRYNKTLKK